MDNTDTLNEANELNPNFIDEYSDILLSAIKSTPNNGKLIITGIGSNADKIIEALNTKLNFIAEGYNIIEFVTIDNRDSIVIDVNKVNATRLSNSENLNITFSAIEEYKIKAYKDSIKDYRVEIKESISQIEFTSKKHTYAQKQRRNVYAKNFYKK